MAANVMAPPTNPHKRQRRTFVPRSKYVGQSAIRTKILRWVWTPNLGLRVNYIDGTWDRSAYTGIRQLLRSGDAVEIDAD